MKRLNNINSFLLDYELKQSFTEIHLDLTNIFAIIQIYKLEFLWTVSIAPCEMNKNPSNVKYFT